MSDTTRVFFERLATRSYEPLLHSVSGTIRCDIEDAGNWFVVVNNVGLMRSKKTRERRQIPFSLVGLRSKQKPIRPERRDRCSIQNPS
jgi:hypothetical protein